jgi:hypothetical protein
MTAIERTAYPRLFKYKNYLKRDLAIYELQATETEYINFNLRNDLQKLNFAVQMKTFQKLGYFIPFDDVPNIIIQSIRKTLNINKGLPLGRASQTGWSGCGYLILVFMFIDNKRGYVYNHAY